MTRIETEAKIEELEEQLLDAQDELKARPTNTIEVEVVREITIENSSMGGDVGKLTSALAKCQGEFKSVHKGSAAHSYNFASLESILTYSQPITSKNDIAIIQLSVSKVIGKTVFAGVKTIISHKDGGWFSSEMYQPVQKTKMNSLSQVIGIVNSYFRRYMVQSVLGLSTTDTDGVVD